MARLSCLFLLTALGNILPSSLAATVEKTWDVGWGPIPGVFPSGTLDKTGILIGGQWPPPKIEVNVGDTIILTVNNIDIDEGVTLHAHGFHQFNNNHQDGPMGITQCDIPSGGSYTYTWHAAVAGTFWIHSHKVGQYPHGLRAPLIVRDDADETYYDYDKDIIMPISDFWDADQSEIDYRYSVGSCCLDVQPSSNNCGLEIPPNRAIVNDSIGGTEDYNASGVEKAIRLRIINMSSFSSFYIFSSDPEMEFEVIEIDGVALERGDINLLHHKWIEIHAGQRYSVRFKPTDSFSLYSVIDPYHYSTNKCAASSLRREPPGAGPVEGTGRYGTALMATANFHVADNPIPEPQFPMTGRYCNADGKKICFIEEKNQKYKIVNLPEWVGSSPVNDDWYNAFTPKNPMPQVVYDPASSTVIHISLTADLNGFANLNNTKFTTSNVPVLLRESMGNDCDASGFIDPGEENGGRSSSSYYGVNNVQRVWQGTTVFMVINSTVGAHPFHLHGQDFQVLWYAKEYDRTRPRPTMPDLHWFLNERARVVNPARRDTLHLASKATAIIAFQANNPGAWFYHCHNDFHAMSGMAGVLVVHPYAWQNGYDYHSVGQSIFDSCSFRTVPMGGGFDDWKRPCCTQGQDGKLNCPPEQDPVVERG